MEKSTTSILAVDDEETLLSTLSRVLRQQGYYVDTASDGRIAINMLQTLPFDLVLLDVMMPDIGGIEVLKYIKDHHFDTEVIMVTAIQEVKTAVECMRLGAYYYITKPYLANDLVALIERAMERKRLVIQNKALKRQIAYRALPTSMITENGVLLEMLDLAMRSAPTKSPVLIQGVTGTGKEVVANFIHTNSLRKDQPFLVLNCSSIPEQLLESELFGHETGALRDSPSDHQGLLEIADGGTLFLDEIGELPLKSQPKLVRFLQTGEFRSVGGSKTLKSDVRIISSTVRDLDHEARANRFREDLLLQLNVITLRLPPLKERKEDIPLLVDQFLINHAGTKQPKKLDRHALEALLKYDWPGNVRELETVVRRAAVLSDSDTISINHIALPRAIPPLRKPSARVRAGALAAGSKISLVTLEKSHIKGVLESVNWNERRAAKILGISAKALAVKLKSYKLRKPR